MSCCQSSNIATITRNEAAETGVFALMSFSDSSVWQAASRLHVWKHFVLRLKSSVKWERCALSLCAGNALLQRRSEFTWIIAFALKAALLCWHPPPLFTDTRWQWLWCSPPRCFWKRGRLVRARAYVVCRGEPFSRREDEHKQKLSLEPKPPGGPSVLHLPGRPPMGASRFPPEKPQSHPTEVKCTSAPLLQ